MNAPVGKITKSFGNRGELTLNLYDTFPEDFNTEEPLIVHIDDLAVPLFCDLFTRRGANGALVCFADFDTPKRASELIGREVFLPESRTEKSDDSEDTEEGLYLEDFVGFKAVFKGTGKEGTVTDFADDGFNPLFVIDYDGREVLVPAADDFIESFSARRRKIVFDLPEGLLELN